MSVFITFAAALLIFGAVIAIHEIGHFAMAKLCGVQVNEFSIGMGPALIKTYRKGTQYTLRLLPVGGFVALEGEESPESTAMPSQMPMTRLISCSMSCGSRATSTR